MTKLVRVCSLRSNNIWYGKLIVCHSVRDVFFLLCKKKTCIVTKIVRVSFSDQIIFRLFVTSRSVLDTRRLFFVVQEKDVHRD